MNPFVLSPTSVGGSLVGYPSFEVTEAQMVAVFGKPNSEWSYCEEDKGYTGFWEFTNGEVTISIGFRWGNARYSGQYEEDGLALDAFLKDTFELVSLGEQLELAEEVLAEVVEEERRSL